jgi:ribosomal-protein-alanine N-acetyltransferase
MQKYLIKTEHLGLRFIRKEDIEHLESLDKDPVVKEFYPEGTLSVTEINAFIAESISACEIENLPC